MMDDPNQAAHLALSRVWRERGFAAAGRDLFFLHDDLATAARTGRTGWINNQEARSEKGCEAGGTEQSAG
jgi:hypothetical protein